jgi:hypothetical protein
MAHVSIKPHHEFVSSGTERATANDHGGAARPTALGGSIGSQSQNVMLAASLGAASTPVSKGAHRP